MTRSLRLFILVMGLAAGPAAAQAVVTTAKQFSARPATGAQHRDAINRAHRLAGAGNLDDALAVARPVVAYCDEQLSRQGIEFVSVADESEYDAYMAGRPGGMPTEWLDIACAGAYTLVGFVHAARRQLDDALPALDRAIAIAPFYVSARTEKGFVLNHLGRYDEAIATYREAVDIAERHPAAAPYRGMALRGIGWALIEQGDLDGAERVYRESLVADPGNRTALNELDHIAALRSAGQDSGE